MLRSWLWYWTKKQGGCCCRMRRIRPRTIIQCTAQSTIMKTARRIHKKMKDNENNPHLWHFSILPTTKTNLILTTLNLKSLNTNYKRNCSRDFIFKFCCVMCGCFILKVASGIAQFSTTRITEAAVKIWNYIDSSGILGEKTKRA